MKELHGHHTLRICTRMTFTTGKQQSQSGLTEQAHASTFFDTNHNLVYADENYKEELVVSAVYDMSHLGPSRTSHPTN